MSGIVIDVEARAEKAQRDLEEINRSLKELSNNANSLGQNLKTAFVGLGSALSITAAFNGLNEISSKFQGLENSIALVTGRTQDLALAQRELKKIALETYGTYQDTATLFGVLGRSMRNSNESMSSLLATTKSLQEAIAISGSSAEATTAAIVQLGQGLSAGALRGDELRSVMEQTPRIAIAIADSLKVSLGNMRKLAAEGFLTSNVVMQAIKDQAGAISKEFKLIIPSMSKALAALKENIENVLDSFNRGAGLSRDIATIFQNMSNKLNKAQLDAELLGAKFSLLKANLMSFNATALNPLYAVLALFGVKLELLFNKLDITKNFIRIFSNVKITVTSLVSQLVRDLYAKGESLENIFGDRSFGKTWEGRFNIFKAIFLNSMDSFYTVFEVRARRQMAGFTQFITTLQVISNNAVLIIMKHMADTFYQAISDIFHFEGLRSVLIGNIKLLVADSMYLLGDLSSKLGKMLKIKSPLDFIFGDTRSISQKLSSIIGGLLQPFGNMINGLGDYILTSSVGTLNNSFKPLQWFLSLYLPDALAKSIFKGLTNTTFTDKINKAISDMLSGIEFVSVNLADMLFNTNNINLLLNALNNITDVIETWINTIKVNLQNSKIMEDFNKLFDGVLVQTNKLEASLDVIKSFGVAVINVFFKIYDAVIGNSWWTDTISAIVDSSQGLWNTAGSGLNKFSAYTIELFAKMFFFVKDSLNSINQIQFGKVFEDFNETIYKLSPTLSKLVGFLEQLSSDVFSTILTAFNSKTLNNPFRAILKDNNGYLTELKKNLVSSVKVIALQIGTLMAAVMAATFAFLSPAGMLRNIFAGLATTKLFSFGIEITDVYFDASLGQKIGEYLGKSVASFFGKTKGSFSDLISELLAMISSFTTSFIENLPIIGWIGKLMTSIASLVGLKGLGGLITAVLFGPKILSIISELGFFSKSIDRIVSKSGKVREFFTGTYSPTGKGRNPTTEFVSRTSKAYFNDTNRVQNMAMLAGMADMAGAFDGIFRDNPIGHSYFEGGLIGMMLFGEQSFSTFEAKVLNPLKDYFSRLDLIGKIRTSFNANGGLRGLWDTTIPRYLSTVMEGARMRLLSAFDPGSISGVKTSFFERLLFAAPADPATRIGKMFISIEDAWNKGTTKIKAIKWMDKIFNPKMLAGIAGLSALLIGALAHADTGATKGPEKSYKESAQEMLNKPSEMAQNAVNTFAINTDASLTNAEMILGSIATIGIAAMTVLKSPVGKIKKLITEFDRVAFMRETFANAMSAVGKGFSLFTKVLFEFVTAPVWFDQTLTGMAMWKNRGLVIGKWLGYTLGSIMAKNFMGWGPVIAIGAADAMLKLVKTTGAQAIIEKVMPIIAGINPLAEANRAKLWKYTDMYSTGELGMKARPYIPSPMALARTMADATGGILKPMLDYREGRGWQTYSPYERAMSAMSKPSPMRPDYLGYATFKSPTVTEFLTRSNQAVTTFANQYRDNAISSKVRVEALNQFASLYTSMVTTTKALVRVVSVFNELGKKSILLSRALMMISTFFPLITLIANARDSKDKSTPTYMGMRADYLGNAPIPFTNMDVPIIPMIIPLIMAYLGVRKGLMQVTHMNNLAEFEKTILNPWKQRAETYAGMTSQQRLQNIAAAPGPMPIAPTSIESYRNMKYISELAATSRMTQEEIAALTGTLAPTKGSYRYSEMSKRPSVSQRVIDNEWQSMSKAQRRAYVPVPTAESIAASRADRALSGQSPYGIIGRFSGALPTMLGYTLAAGAGGLGAAKIATSFGASNETAGMVGGLGAMAGMSIAGSVIDILKNIFRAIGERLIGKVFLFGSIIVMGIDYLFNENSTLAKSIKKVSMAMLNWAGFKIENTDAKTGLKESSARIVAQLNQPLEYDARTIDRERLTGQLKDQYEESISRTNEASKKYIDEITAKGIASSATIAEVTGNARDLNAIAKKAVIASQSNVEDLVAQFTDLTFLPAPTNADSLKMWSGDKLQKAVDKIQTLNGVLPGKGTGEITAALESLVYPTTYSKTEEGGYRMPDFRGAEIGYPLNVMRELNKPLAPYEDIKKRTQEYTVENSIEQSKWLFRRLMVGSKLALSLGKAEYTDPGIQNQIDQTLRVTAEQVNLLKKRQVSLNLNARDLTEKQYGAQNISDKSMYERSVSFWDSFNPLRTPGTKTVTYKLKEGSGTQKLVDDIQKNFEIRDQLIAQQILAMAQNRKAKEYQASIGKDIVSPLKTAGIDVKETDILGRTDEIKSYTSSITDLYDTLQFAKNDTERSNIFVNMSNAAAKAKAIIDDTANSLYDLRFEIRDKFQKANLFSADALGKTDNIAALKDLDKNRADLLKLREEANRVVREPVLNPLLMPKYTVRNPGLDVQETITNPEYLAKEKENTEKLRKYRADVAKQERANQLLPYQTYTLNKKALDTIYSNVDSRNFQIAQSLTDSTVMSYKNLGEEAYTYLQYQKESLAQARQFALETKKPVAYVAELDAKIAKTNDSLTAFSNSAESLLSNIEGLGGTNLANTSTTALENVLALAIQIKGVEADINKIDINHVEDYKARLEELFSKRKSLFNATVEIKSTTISGSERESAIAPLGNSGRGLSATTRTLAASLNNTLNIIKSGLQYIEGDEAFVKEYNRILELNRALERVSAATRSYSDNVSSMNETLGTSFKVEDIFNFKLDRIMNAANTLKLKLSEALADSDISLASALSEDLKNLTKQASFISMIVDVSAKIKNSLQTGVTEGLDLIKKVYSNFNLSERNFGALPNTQRAGMIADTSKIDMLNKAISENLLSQDMVSVIGKLMPDKSNLNEVFNKINEMFLEMGMKDLKGQVGEPMDKLTTSVDLLRGSIDILNNTISKPNTQIPSSTPNAQTPSSTPTSYKSTNNLDKIFIDVGKALNVDPNWIKAQSDMETTQQTSGIFKNANNLFNISASEIYRGNKYQSGNGRLWRSYNSPEASGEDYVKLISEGNYGKYKPAMGSKTAEEYFTKLQKGGYAEESFYVDSMLKKLSDKSFRRIPELPTPAVETPRSYQAYTYPTPPDKVGIGEVEPIARTQMYSGILSKFATPAYSMFNSLSGLDFEKKTSKYLDYEKSLDGKSRYPVEKSKTEYMPKWDVTANTMISDVLNKLPLKAFPDKPMVKMEPAGEVKKSFEEYYPSILTDFVNTAKESLITNKPIASENISKFIPAENLAPAIKALGDLNTINESTLNKSAQSVLNDPTSRQLLDDREKFGLSIQDIAKTSTTLQNDLLTLSNTIYDADNEITNKLKKGLDATDDIYKSERNKVIRDNLIKSNAFNFTKNTKGLTAAISLNGISEQNALYATEAEKFKYSTIAKAASDTSEKIADAIVNNLPTDKLVAARDKYIDALDDFNSDLAERAVNLAREAGKIFAANTTSTVKDAFKGMLLGQTDNDKTPFQTFTDKLKTGLKDQLAEMFTNSMMNSLEMGKGGSITKMLEKTGKLTSATFSGMGTGLKDIFTGNMTWDKFTGGISSWWGDMTKVDDVDKTPEVRFDEATIRFDAAVNRLIGGIGGTPIADSVKGVFDINTVNANGVSNGYTADGTDLAYPLTDMASAVDVNAPSAITQGIADTSGYGSTPELTPLPGAGTMGGAAPLADKIGGLPDQQGFLDSISDSFSKFFSKEGTGGSIWTSFTDLLGGKDGSGGLFGGLKNMWGSFATEGGAGSGFLGMLSGIGKWFGSIGGAATGGQITGAGTATSDSIPTMLSNGEFIVNAKATAKNLPMLHAINGGKVQHHFLGSLLSSASSLMSIGSSVATMAAGPAPAAGGIGAAGGMGMLSQFFGMFGNLFKSDGPFGKLFGNVGSGFSDLFKNLWGGEANPLGAAGGAALNNMFSSKDLGFSFAAGGQVSGPGTGTSDSIPAMLSHGEFVINAAATARHRDLLHQINSGRVPTFATGGIVDAAAPIMTKPISGNTKLASTSGAMNKNQQVINLNITGDISRQTKQEIYKMMPSIADGVNSQNKEKGYRR
jgi:tape measure domain-containing protein